MQNFTARALGSKIEYNLHRINKFAANMQNANTYMSRAIAFKGVWMMLNKKNKNEGGRGSENLVRIYNE